MRISLAAGSPGTMASAVSPPSMISSWVSIRRPPLVLSASWQRTQFRSRMGWMSLMKSGAATTAWVAKAIRAAQQEKEADLGTSGMGNGVLLQRNVGQL